MDNCSRVLTCEVHILESKLDYKLGSIMASNCSNENNGHLYTHLLQNKFHVSLYKLSNLSVTTYFLHVHNV